MNDWHSFYDSFCNNVVSSSIRYAANTSDNLEDWLSVASIVILSAIMLGIPLPTPECEHSDVLC